MKEEIITVLEQQKISSKKGWIILFDGERLIMNSGKLIWDERHHALNALIRSLKDLTGYPTTQKNNIELQEVTKQLILDGRIKIENLL